jgi:hypothetical protein
MISRADRAELKKFLDAVPQIQVVLGRHAEHDPEAARLHEIVVALSAGEASTPGTIYLAAADGKGAPSERDLGGHPVARYEGAPENCARCTVALAEAGDFSADVPPGTFATSERHVAAQRYVLSHPGVRYLEALQRIEQETP